VPIAEGRATTARGVADARRGTRTLAAVVVVVVAVTTREGVVAPTLPRRISPAPSPRCRRLWRADAHWMSQ